MTAKKKTPSKRVARATASPSNAAAGPFEVLGTGGVPNFRMNADYADSKKPIFWFELHTAIQCQTEDDFNTLKGLLREKSKDLQSIKKILDGKVHDKPANELNLTALLSTAFGMRKI